MLTLLSVQYVSCRNTKGWNCAEYMTICAHGRHPKALKLNQKPAQIWSNDFTPERQILSAAGRTCTWDVCTRCPLPSLPLFSSFSSISNICVERLAGQRGLCDSFWGFQPGDRCPCWTFLFCTLFLFVFTRWFCLGTKNYLVSYRKRLWSGLKYASS